MKRSLREKQRFDYRVYHQTGVKQAKEEARVSKVVDRLDQALVMEDNKVIDKAVNLKLEVERFYDEYDLDILEGIDDIKEGIVELKNLTKKYMFLIILNSKGCSVIHMERNTLIMMQR